MAKEVIQNMPQPRTLVELKRVVGVKGNGRVKVIEWLNWLAEGVEQNCPELVVSGIAILSEQWFKVKECLFILNVDTRGWFEANKKLSQSVLGPAFLKLGWLPDYYLWTKEELQAAKEKQHPLWERARREGLTFYGQRLLDGQR